MKIIKAFCLIIFAAFLVNAQTPDETKKEELATEITIARSGWSDPIFANDIQFSKEGFAGLIEDVPVQAKLYTFNKAKLIYFESCNPQNDKKDPQNIRRNYIVSHFTVYEANGRIFAYGFTRLVLNSPKLLDDGSIGLNTGCSPDSEFLFVDEDGDGTFEKRCQSAALEPIPQWIKDLGQIRFKPKKPQ